ncbi:MAG: hypothetical protein QM682_16945 [Paracoccus sp. (in: a-proteobacteria)]|uniref:hypothetical protein n=1 Tax=Paracoccus sp. TaxID=267 RepID=UPI0039E3AF20
MTKAEPYIGNDGEVRELDGEFVKAARRGRPPMLGGERKIRMNFMIDPDLAAALDEQPNKSALVNEALRKILS